MRGRGTDDEEEEVRRTIWSEEECVALSTAWINVCDDPIRSSNQRIDNMWNRIAQAYGAFKPADGKFHTSEECRKTWDRLRTAVSRFAGLYENNIRMFSSGQTMEDAKRMSMQEFPEPHKHGPFKHWDSYVVLMESEKFRVGVAAGWPKRQRNLAGDYSSSAGFADLPDDAEEIPTPPLFNRRRRPIGQKTTMRMSRGGASSGSQEVQSEAPTGVQPTPEFSRIATIQHYTNMIEAIKEWRATDDPIHKEMLQGFIDLMRRDLGLPPIGGGGASGDSDAVGTGLGDDEE